MIDVLRQHRDKIYSFTIRGTVVFVINPLRSYNGFCTFRFKSCPELKSLLKLRAYAHWFFL